MKRVFALLTALVFVSASQLDAAQTTASIDTVRLRLDVRSEKGRTIIEVNSPIDPGIQWESTKGGLMLSGGLLDRSGTEVYVDDWQGAHKLTTDNPYAAADAGLVFSKITLIDGKKVLVDLPSAYKLSAVPKPEPWNGEFIKFVLPNQESRIETRFYTLSYADPSRVSVLINGLASANNQSDNIEAQPYASRYLKDDELKTPDSTQIVHGESGTGNAPELKSSRIQHAKVHFDSGSAPYKYLVVRAPTSEFPWIRDIIFKLDQAPLQVELQVKLFEMRSNDLDQLGVDARALVNSLDFTFKEAKRPFVSDDRAFEAFSLGDVFRENPLKLRALVTALCQQGHANIIDETNLMSMDGLLASYFAGERIPYTSASRTGTTAPTTSFANVGVELQFIPRLDDVNGTITLHVVPVVSSISEFRELSDGSQAPVIAVRQAETIIRVLDGETFVIAGMIKRHEVESIRKIPGLGELPLLGKLFRSKQTDEEHTELCLFVTPHIVCEEGEADNEWGGQSFEEWARGRIDAAN